MKTSHADLLIASSDGFTLAEQLQDDGRFSDAYRVRALIDHMRQLSQLLRERDDAADQVAQKPASAAKPTNGGHRHKYDPATGACACGAARKRTRRTREQLAEVVTLGGDVGAEGG